MQLHRLNDAIKVHSSGADLTQFHGSRRASRHRLRSGANGSFTTEYKSLVLSISSTRLMHAPRTATTACMVSLDSAPHRTAHRNDRLYGQPR